MAETVAALKVVALEAGFMAALRAATTGAETIAEAIATILYVLIVFVVDADQAQVQSMYLKVCVKGGLNIPYPSDQHSRILWFISGCHMDPWI